MSLNLNPRTSAAANIHVVTSSELHPDYQYWNPVWQRIRDAEIGEVQVKAKAQKYLPKLAGHNNEQYRSFLGRAVFYNMTAKTLNALYGSLFKRAPVVVGYQPKTRFSKDGQSLNLTAKLAAKEVLAVGRFGMLVDAAPDGAGGPFVATYTTENILDWETGEIDGENCLTRVVLRELGYDRNEAKPYGVDFTSRFRVLALTPSPRGWEYEVQIYDDQNGAGLPDFRFPPIENYVPTVRGRALDYIPFQFVGPFHNAPDVQKPPLLDIVTLNFSHYQSYAALEQGRFYTANPVYTVSSGVADDESGEYYVGPDVVWELGKDGKAGILEFTGRGLSSLENALTQKEAQVSSIGGRMLTPHTGPGESDGALRMREKNEQSLLLNLSDCLDEAFTNVLKWLADWNNAPKAQVEETAFEVAREFQNKQAGARELRAIHQMYADGVIPGRVLHDFLRKADVIPDWLDFEEFRKLLNDESEFPNMANVLARMRGFPDAQTWAESQ